MKKILSKIFKPKLFLPLVSLFCASIITGCYTQIYTGEYGPRPLENYPNRKAVIIKPSGSDSTAIANSISEDSIALDDSIIEAESGRNSAPVIVNYYYSNRPYYRGYSAWDWDYPTLSFGLYSSRYQSYNDPYWWHDDYFRRQRIREYRNGYYYNGDGYHNHGSHYSPPPSTGSGGNNSNNPPRSSLFTPPPNSSHLQKGHRSNRSDAIAPSNNTPPGNNLTPPPSNQSNPPAPKQSAEPAPTQNSTPSENNDNHERLQKGKRR